MQFFMRQAFVWPLEKKKDLASYVLDNNGSRDQLVSQVVTQLKIIESQLID